GRVRHAIALVSGGERLGVMTLGERVTRDRFSVEDLDLLKTISDQAAASLRNARLSQQLVRAKEMENFQMLSAFFVHDLKNLASMLSLTVQNLPRNYDNPRFRDDALRVMSESVAKINAMCAQLSMVTRQLAIEPVPADLRDLVSRTLESLNGSLGVPVTCELGATPKVAVDPEQMGRVIVNLVLNARDATRAGGEIRIATGETADGAALTVADTGCGMSEEFVQQSLFRPFRTTKSEGMGIGLFQSKRIVEAHHGRIEVESREGQGSVFRVILPTSP
ncbi:MAG: ATP-binding protein, partial [Candidatus Binatia bacterium]